jgi:histidinol phosphatase-like enzyme
MLLEAATWYDLDLPRSWMVGDRMTDVEAGHRAGMRTVLLGTSDPVAESKYAPPEIHAANLLDAALQIIARSPALGVFSE